MITSTIKKIVLVAIPCYNEQLTIGSIILLAKRYASLVLAVDDGSNDRTSIIAADAGAKVIHHGINKGYGAAVRSCFEFAKLNNIDILIIMDGDGQHNPDCIPNLLNKMEESKSDIIIGSRFLVNKNSIPLYRKVGMKVLNIFTKMASNLDITDSQSGFRAYNRKAINSINISDDKMGAGSEILVQAQLNNLKISEVPIIARYDIKNTSKQNPVTHAYDVIDSIIWQVAHKRPLLYIGVPGFILTLIAIMSGLFLLQLYNQTKYFSLPLAMVVAIFGIIGVIFLFMGIMFNIMSRIRNG
jgi:glycosyltransferase involved in cell wall biosynthesis